MHRSETGDENRFVLTETAIHEKFAETPHQTDAVMFVMIWRFRTVITKGCCVPKPVAIVLTWAN